MVSLTLLKDLLHIFNQHRHPEQEMSSLHERVRKSIQLQIIVDRRNKT